MKSRLVCLCNIVTESEIIETLNKGAASSKEISEITRAGTICGRCLPEIDSLVDEYFRNSNHPQYRIDFK